jgi:hypothetical protein
MSNHRITTIAVALALSAGVPATAAAVPAPPSTGPSVCSEVCSGGPANLVVTARPASPSVCSEVCSGGPANGVGRISVADTTTRPAVVRINSADGGFHWRDAGVGAGAILVLTAIGMGGTYTVTNVRRHAGRAHHPRG